ncbi:hypothetical protein [Streptomyces sp. NBC_01708]|uniref:hypothetical protein n=1 Tax=Streptomyces sp. NBC_01708 TaxID=2975915 RepID=UPI002E31C86A|nr:hypothetical protein [Streptomyces sp. NBC_01708]
MATTIRTALSAARARRIARHLRGVNFCDTCAQVSDSAARATESRQDARLTAFTYAR